MVSEYVPKIVGGIILLVALKMFSITELFDALIKKKIKEEYDYIVVGGGTSGSVIASRLGEDNNRTILVLEAGKNSLNVPEIDVPIYADRLLGSEFDWHFETTPQKYCCKSHVNSSTIWHAGKGLGGSSLINYMQYLRGSRHDYDEWANQGATGWAYKDVLPYFIKSEDNKNGEFVRTVFHGFGGRMSVADAYQSTTSKINEAAFKEMNITKRDVNGKNHFGYSQTQTTIRFGQRLHTFRAFLKRMLHVSHVNVVPEATVQKIIFDGKRAVAVNFMHKGKLKTVKAKKEIILSAGTIGSAQILLLSGVGPKAHLQSLKIPVVADLPVGENLQDHVMANGIEFYSPYAVSVTPTKAENFVSSWLYSIFGIGMKASPRFREGNAYLRTRHQPPNVRYPLIAFSIVSNVAAYQADHINLKEETYQTIHGSPAHKEGFTIFPILLHPKSKGTVRLQSTNPEDPPLINPNYLQEEADVKLLAEAFQFVRRNLASTEVLRHWNTKINAQVIPECSKLGHFTNEYVECYIRHVTHPGRSPIGTCKVGAIGDNTAVVDPLLRVRGLKGIRVIDASIIPSPTSGNSYTTQVMIGEKAADMLREKDTVKAIKDYFKHLIAVRHHKFVEEEDGHQATTTAGAPPPAAGAAAPAAAPAPAAHNGKKPKK